MFYIDNDSGVTVMPPVSAQRSAIVRWFSEGDGNNVITWPGMDWFNIVQAELLNTLEEAGIQPDKTKLNQLALSIKAIMSNNALLIKNNLSEIKTAGASAQRTARENLDIYDASLNKKGLVQLTSATDSPSETLAATAKAVKIAMDNANARLAKDRNGADIPNKPLFIQNVGLQETVNRAGNAVQKTGDTLSGGLTFENDSILAWIRNTDWAKIGFKNDADSDTDSYMWFETGDNGNEYFKWRSKQSTTTKDLMNLKWDALSVLVKALFSSEVKISTVNALRIFNSSFGAIFRRSEECLHIIPTRENEGENGDIGPLRPFTLNLRTGRISMGHGLDVTGDIFANRFAINSSTGMWIHMRDQNVILGRNAVSTDGAQALLRQDHADRKFMIGGLGNKQFGIYMINNSRTANGTDGQAYMDNNGNWLCGSQVIPGNYGNFDSRYVKDVRLGSQQYYGVNNWQTWNFQCPSGHVLSGINVQDTGSNSADNIAGVYYRPVQKYINGTWYNVASV
ncbi:phage tail protein [Escherichia coli]|uniref:phage tail protein n=4 Tax=Escherichia coli TaxID=562 RepID=UPI000B7C5A80|nr:phage tail protein [Escherichia coli]EBM8085627.1 phage tail protein [Salmonella enterica subsp. enterica serovar Montevideo]EGO5532466.1 phage tail protein [Salmonella enterica]HCR8442455.1 tail fiber protein [Shigella flexneri]EBO5614093.1 phage tail protein [Salmonella enterica subsp. enterica serovar Montevideo]ECJ2236320.1 phage tail protein [Salmonella enterica subsp. enterica serovar Montevideo]